MIRPLSMILALALLFPPPSQAAHGQRGGAATASGERLPTEVGSPRAGGSRIGVSAGCQGEWMPTFGGEPGMDDEVHALTTFDDGSGSALYAGGHFRSAGGQQVRFLAKRSGTSWVPVGSGVDGSVNALVVHDDGAGGGPALYAAGGFSEAGGLDANKIARWDGSQWSSLGGGFNGPVYALAVYDDGSGPALYAGGTFTLAGGGVAYKLAKWDGTSWSPLGSGLDGTVKTLAVYDDGSGPALYAGGFFMMAGGVSTKWVAKWDGTSWSALGSGMNSYVQGLAVHDDGSGGGQALYACGDFTRAGGITVGRVAKWNGTSWSAVGSGMEWAVLSLVVHDEGSGNGPELFAGGAFATAGGIDAKGIAKWDGTQWSAVGGGIHSPQWSPLGVRALATVDLGGGGPAALVAGGVFASAGPASARNIAHWDGTSWSAFGAGLNGAVRALTTHDAGTGSGPALYAAGDFTDAAGVAASRIARWNGMSWSALAEGLSNRVHAVLSHDEGSGAGPALFAGGEFTSYVRKWNGSKWLPLAGLDGSVRALAVFDDGSGGGPALYAGGSFTSAGGISAKGIAKWDGTSWIPLGSGLEMYSVVVCSLAVHDDGSGTGPALHVGGKFETAGGASAINVAKWDGLSWSALGNGLGYAGSQDQVLSLAVYDDGGGGGPALYAGGTFTISGALALSRVAKWDGTSWSALGGGTNDFVHALVVHDDGSGSGARLYAGGRFTSAGGLDASRVASWDGNSWSAPASGPSEGDPNHVLALAVHDDGSGLALYAGGSFTASPAGDSYLAHWGGCTFAVGTPYCFGDGSGTSCPCANEGAPEAGCANSIGMGGLLIGHGSSSVAADDLSFVARQLPVHQPALLIVGGSAVNGGNGNGFGDGLRCAGGGVRRLGVEIPNAEGAASFGPGLAGAGGWTAGDTRHFQLWYRDPAGPCGSGFNLSNGYELAFTD